MTYYDIYTERTSARSFPIFGVIFGGIAVAAFILFSVFYLRNLRSSSTSRRSEPVTTVDANIDLEGVQVETVQRGLGEEELAREGSTEAERLGEDRGNSLFEQEKALLEALEKSRIANVARIGAFGSERRRFLEAEKVRLAELGKRRLLEAERQRLPEAERLRLMEEDRLKLTDEIKLKLSDSELTKLATAERARLVNEMAVSRLRLQVEAVNRQLVTESEDAPPHPLIDYIPEERLVSMNTSAGVCLILADGAEILHRVSLDCQHAIGAAAVSQYLERSENCGPFPLRCPLCLADGPTAGIITESPLRALVAAGVISEDLCVSILNKHIRLNRDQASLEVLYTTSKACPFCSIRIIHYRGHSCHHITPGDGCPSCHNHFCYSCLGYTGDGAAWQGCPNGCRSACDETCSCPDCPDCRRGTPCVFCSYPSYTECRVCSSV